MLYPQSLGALIVLKGLILFWVFFFMREKLTETDRNGGEKN